MGLPPPETGSTLYTIIPDSVFKFPAVGLEMYSAVLISGRSVFFTCGGTSCLHSLLFINIGTLYHFHVFCLHFIFSLPMPTI